MSYPILPLSFYDLTARFHTQLSKRDQLYISGYLGRDVIRLKMDEDRFKSKWGNTLLTTRWNHVYKKGLAGNLLLIYSKYELEAEASREGVYSSYAGSSIEDRGLGYEVLHTWGNHTIRTGIRSTHHQFMPRTRHDQVTIGQNAFHLQEKQELEAYENNLFVEDEWKLHERLSFNIGLRGSMWTSKQGNYQSIEPRMSAKWSFADDWALKGSYSRMNQYMHLVSEVAGIGLPTDVWVPSSQFAPPQQSNQWALGIHRDIVPLGLGLSVEGYYKDMNNIVACRPGTSLLSGNWEEGITTGQGKSYGAELLLQRKKGKFSGWASYTLSWTKYQFDELNSGKEFFAKQDARHVITLTGFYKPSPRVRLSAVWTLTSATPFYVPRTQYLIKPHQSVGETIPVGTTHAVNAMNMYGSANGNNTLEGLMVSDAGALDSFRGEANHRLDIGIQMIKPKKRGERIWELGVYNAYGAGNPLMFYGKQDGVERSLYKVQWFAIPSVTYVRKF